MGFFADMVEFLSIELCSIEGRYVCAANCVSAICNCWYFCGYGGIGRHARFRFWCASVQVQVLLSAFYSERSLDDKSSKLFFCKGELYKLSGTITDALPNGKSLIRLDYDFGDKTI